MARMALTALVLAAVLELAPPASAAESMEVPLGGAETLRLGQAAHQVVIGNPAVADVTLGSPRSLTVFGKYPGGTTLSVLDGDGRVVLDLNVVVTDGSAAAVSVHYGTGKSWTPGGTVTVVECGRGRCAPAMALPTESPFKSQSAAPAPPAK